MIAKHFKDFYGCTATITEMRDRRWKLHISGGRFAFVKVYDTYRGARIAMGRMGDCWQEIDTVSY